MHRIKYTVVLSILFVLVSTIPCGAFFDKYGMSASIGGLSDHALGHTSSEHAFYWHSVGLFGQKDLSTKWYGDLEGDIGWLYWDGRNGERSDHVLSLEMRMVIMRKVFKHLHLGIGGGLCLLADSHNHPGLGDDGLYGLITVKARIPFYTSESKHECGFDVENDHISGVTDEDAGRNVVKLRFYYTF